jgi:hypothetical protein
MLLGCDVTERFSDPHAAIQSRELSYATVVPHSLRMRLLRVSASVAPALLQKGINLLLPGKKNQMACSALLADLSETPLRTPLRTPTVPIPGASFDSRYRGWQN